MCGGGRRGRGEVTYVYLCHETEGISFWRENRQSLQLHSFSSVNVLIFSELEREKAFVESIVERSGGPTGGFCDFDFATTPTVHNFTRVAHHTGRSLVTLVHSESLRLH